LKQKTQPEPLELDFEAALSDDEFEEIMKELEASCAPDERKQAEAADYLKELFN
jgi:hypothetical protein